MFKTAPATEGFADYMRACDEWRQAVAEAAAALSCQREWIARGLHAPRPQGEIDALVRRAKAQGVAVRRKAEAVAAAARRRLRRHGDDPAVREKVRQEVGEIERAAREAVAPMETVEKIPIPPGRGSH